MTKFTIWAPKAKEVLLCVGKEEYQMEALEGGFWELKLNSHKGADLYAFKVDGKGPFPDPRSEFQPEGVHGWSQKWKNPFAWGDSGWNAPELKNALIYELHVGTFSAEGTFNGVERKLDYLVELGVTHVELMPVAAFPGNHGWGYDGVALYAPHKTYGNPDQLKHLINACHLKGLAIILDVVYNHLGPDGNYLSQFAPYFSKKYQTPWGEAVNFDDSYCDQVREFVIDNAMMWLRDFHFDGLRIDAVHAIFDFSATHILEELQIHVNELMANTGRNLFLIAESDLNDPRIIHGLKRGGYGLASQWLDDFHHSLHVTLTGENQRYFQDFSGPEDLQKCLSQNFVYDGQFSAFRKRNHGRKADDILQECFVAFTQNHDQIGNRGAGERLCHLASQEKCQIASAILLLSPFIPMLFQGEEWACSSPFLYFTDHSNPQLIKAIREGREKENLDLGKTNPDPQNPDTFAQSCILWEEIAELRSATMLKWYKNLIRLRKEYLDHIRRNLPTFNFLNQDNNLYLYSAGNLQLLINNGDRKGIFEESKLPEAKILLQNKPVEIVGEKLIASPGTVVILLINENNFIKGATE